MALESLSLLDFRGFPQEVGPPGAVLALDMQQNYTNSEKNKKSSSGPASKDVGPVRISRLDHRLPRLI
jgi:hypothetical protein